METKKIKVGCKSTELISVLQQNFAGKINLARIKFIGLLLCAMCKVKSVNFEKIKSGVESEANSNSVLRRIQRFVADYVLDYDLVAKLIFSLLPHKPPYLYCTLQYKCTKYAVSLGS